jgi:hypothetical protein
MQGGQTPWLSTTVICAARQTKAQVRLTNIGVVFMDACRSHEFPNNDIALGVILCRNVLALKRNLKPFY